MNSQWLTRFAAAFVLSSAISYCKVEASAQDPNNVQPAAVVVKQDSTIAIADTVHWVPYDQGVKVAKETGKPIVLFCYGNWCQYSQYMLNRTFHDTTVVNYLNSYFTPVRIETQSTTKSLFNGVSMTEAQIANRQFGVTAVPCTWLIDSDGCRIKKLRGKYPAKYLLPELQAVHDHTYGDCQNVPLNDVPQQPKVQQSSTNTK